MSDASELSAAVAAMRESTAAMTAAVTEQGRQMSELTQAVTALAEGLGSQQRRLGDTLREHAKTGATRAAAVRAALREVADAPAVGARRAD